MADPWAVLGLVPGSSWDEVRAAHRRLAQALHPDVTGSDSDHRRMAAVNEAFAALTAEFDRTGGISRAIADSRAASSARDDDAVGFSIDLLPAEAFEALLIVASFLGDPWVIDE